ncbi:hypothetical protein JOF53_005131 [Crossiella equi]|uniref:Uncharacterized protein n=1 Tax=Crossiella equi TaxID=130796 RepID=A0ABS5AJ68_9PSEU|nr:hypothetical protein [Crossiella equi]MBP2476259.1 hypothetical protein [Crossiella equi]
MSWPPHGPPPPWAPPAARLPRRPGVVRVAFALLLFRAVLSGLELGFARGGLLAWLPPAAPDLLRELISPLVVLLTVPVLMALAVKVRHGSGRTALGLTVFYTLTGLASVLLGPGSFGLFVLLPTAVLAVLLAQPAARRYFAAMRPFRAKRPPDPPC